MSNFWNQEGLPHKGWRLVDVIDIREDNQPEWETNYETCMMCGNVKIRYVHILEHNEISKQYRVGCDCAEKMTNDYINPNRRERDLRNKASRRKTWTKKNWNVSKNGNYYINVEGTNITIFKDKTTFKYKVKIGETFGQKSFKSFEEAKIAAFNGIEYLKENGEWNQ